MKAKIRIQISVIAENMAESGEVINYFDTEIGNPSDVDKSSRAIIAGLVVVLAGMLRVAMKKFFEFNEVK